MRTKLFLIAFLFLLSPYAYGQYNYNQKLGGLGSIALPEKPEIKKIRDLNIYIAKYKQVVFLAQAQDISGGLKDLFRSNNLDSTYNAFVNGAVGTSKGKVFYKNNILINGNKALEFGYKANIKGQDLYSYIRVVALNDSLLMTGIMASDSLSHNHPALENFFKGFKVANKKDLGLKKAENWGRKTGYALGIVITIGIMVGIGLAIVFLIKKIAYKNKR
nr:hypothetical protein [Mucilaginibacter sp. L294]